MVYESIESYYLTDDELYVLLAGNGREKWYGFSQENNPEQIKRVDDIHKILAGLYQKDAIRWKGEKAVLVEPFLSMVQALVRAKVCVNVKKIQEAHSLRSHYFYDNRVVFLERSQRQEDTLRITQMNIEGWMDYIEEEGYFPDHIQGGESKEPYPGIGWERNSDVCAIEDAHSVFEKTDTDTGRVSERLFVKEQGLSSFLYLQMEGRWIRSVCKRSNWTEILKKWVDQRK
ncbi:MAG: hypothetical protein K2O96_06525 [Lachnospiraceae bacterium]|nr:hypothetical protein [Lachnospiraceae bacterium]